MLILVCRARLAKILEFPRHLERRGVTWYDFGRLVDQTSASLQRGQSRKQNCSYELRNVTAKRVGGLVASTTIDYSINAEAFEETPAPQPGRSPTPARCNRRANTCQNKISLGLTCIQAHSDIVLTGRPYSHQLQKNCRKLAAECIFLFRSHLHADHDNSEPLEAGYRRNGNDDAGSLPQLTATNLCFVQSRPMSNSI